MRILAYAAAIMIYVSSAFALAGDLGNFADNPDHWKVMEQQPDYADFVRPVNLADVLMSSEYSSTPALTGTNQLVTEDHWYDWTWEWSKTDVNIEIVWVLMNAIDWRQTQYISKHPDRFKETNGRLDDHPSMGAVNRHFLRSYFWHMTGSVVLPRPLRRVYQIWSISYEWDPILKNYRAGVRFEVPLH